MMEYKEKEIGDYTDVELIINKHNLIKETYNAVDRGHYHSARAYLDTLTKIDKELERRK